MYHLPPGGEGGRMGWTILRRITWLSGGTEGGISCCQRSLRGDFRKLSVNQLPKNTEPHEGMR